MAAESDDSDSFSSCMERCDQSESATISLHHLRQWLLEADQRPRRSTLYSDLNDGRLSSMLWHHMSSDKKAIIAQAKSCVEVTLDLLEKAAALQPSSSSVAVNSPPAGKKASTRKKIVQKTAPNPEPAFLSTLLRKTFDQIERKSSLVTLDVLQSRYDLGYLVGKAPNIYDLLFRSSLQSLEINKRAKLALNVLEFQGRQFGINANEGVATSEQNRRAWLDLWVPSLLNEMEVDEARKLHPVTSYYLPSLLEMAPWCLVYLVDLLCQSTSPMTLLAVLRSAKELDLCRIADACSRETEVLLGSEIEIPTFTSTRVLVVPPSILAAFLTSSSAQAQSAALSILVGSKSIASPLSDEEVRLAQLHITYNFSQTNADLRQTTMVKLNKFLSRLRATSHAAHHTLSKARERNADDLAMIESASEVVVQRAKSFALWLFEKAFASTHPGSPYHLTRTGIHFLEMLLVSGLDPHYTASERRKGRAQATIPLGHSWPFTLDLVSPRLVDRLLECHGSTYIELQEKARAMLLCLPSLLPARDERQLSERILLHAKELMLSPREFQSEAGASLSGLYLDIYVKRLGWKWSPISSRRSLEYADRHLQFISDHLCFLDDLLDISAKETRVASAESFPLHGTLVTLQRLFTSIDLERVPAAELRRVKEQAIDLIDRVWEVTRGILCNSAPEGSTSQVSDHETARALEESSLEEGDDEGASEALGSTPRYQLLLTYSWRGMKEASAFLGAIVTKTLSAGPATTQMLWSKEELQGVGRRFNTWLSLIRHRGAFSTVYPAYSAASAAIARSQWEEVDEYSSKWLSTFLDSIASPEASISTTRRSAGIGYAVLALLCSLTDDSKAVIINDTLTRLVGIVETSPSPSCQIHALNILRVIVADASLADSLDQKIGSLFILVIPRFTSDSWHIRNASMMLFSELAIRAFGKNLNRDDVDVRVKYDWQDFFTRFYGLDSVLYKRLQEPTLATASSEIHQSSLFTVLLIISRLQVFNDEQILGGLGISTHTFAAVIEQCLQSPFWKLREIAASALAATTSPVQSLTYSRKLLDGCVVGNANETHGRLLAVQRILLNTAQPEIGRQEESDAFLTKLSGLLSTLHSICSSKGQSRAAQIVCLEICISLKSSFPTLRLDEQSAFCLHLLQSDEAASPITTALQAQLLAASTNLVLIARADLLGMTIQHGSRSVRREAVRFILQADDKTKSQSHYEAILALLVNEQEQVTTRVDVARILDQMACPLQGQSLLQACQSLSSLAFKSSNTVFRDQCLPCLARMLTALHREPDVSNEGSVDMLQACLSAICSASKPEESIESRLAAVRAVNGLRPLLFPSRRTSFDADPSTANVLFQGRLSLLKLAEDDDEDVRMEAANVLRQLNASGQYSTSYSNASLKEIHEKASTLPRSSSASVRLLWDWMGSFYDDVQSSQWQAWAWSTLMLGDGQTKEEDKKVDATLFAEEKPNQYVDDLEEWRRCYEYCREKQVAAGMLVSDEEVESALRRLASEAELLHARESSNGWDTANAGSRVVTSPYVHLQRLSWCLDLLLDHPAARRVQEDCVNRGKAAQSDLHRLLASPDITNSEQ
ncbi:hypothetical protein CBS101457_003055 [Exobasidium rhododendri]|nr:hypothetical protein CBS101457_003055 [Exobasidium rhododendri]